jgi:hypothetical protein
MTARHCGDCQLCCKLLPVKELGKVHGERCRYQHTGKGCSVHAQLARIAPSCAFWSCAWLVDPEATKLPRPDRCHFVVDIVPDFVHATPPGGERIDIPVMQVWIDPAFPAAAESAALRAWIEHVADTRGLATIVRFNSRDAYTVFAPSLSPDGQWHRVGGEIKPETEAGLRHMIDRAEHGDSDARRLLRQNQPTAV